jgi:hypothetical protein
VEVFPLGAPTRVLTLDIVKNIFVCYFQVYRPALKHGVEKNSQKSEVGIGILYFSTKGFQVFFTVLGRIKLENFIFSAKHLILPLFITLILNLLVDFTSTYSFPLYHEYEHCEYYCRG